jgi:16S rRNA (uracil1498-N3)-methyltransferase
MAHPGGIPLREAITPARTGAAQSIAAAVGPEGGFTDEEVAHGAALGWQFVDVGPRIRRVETAAIALAACIGQLDGAFQ